MDQGARYELYVAYAIGRGGAFITANILVDLETPPVYGGTVVVGGQTYAVARSRPSGIRGSIKLLHPGLTDLSDPGAILAFFKQLSEQGWTVESERFEKQHAKALRTQRTQAS